MHNEIPMIDLQAAHAELGDELERAALSVLRSGWYILGDHVERFEQEFSSWLGLPPAAAVGVGSGTDALHLALRACAVGAGDEVIVPSHTAVATIAAVELAGARPVFVDIQPETYTVDPVQVAAAITARTKAVIPVHLYGQAADMEAILEIAGQAGIWVIEDCAQAHGARHKGSVTGTMGDLGCFSFYPTKNLAAAGDGGMVVSRHRQLAERVRFLRQYGWHTRYVSDLPGLNSRLDELQAALLQVKLGHLDGWNRRRQTLANLYDELLSGTGVVTPHVMHGNEHVYHLYVVRTQRRDALRSQLAACGIASAVHYPVPVHRQPAYRHLAPPPGALIETELAAVEILSLPLYPQMSTEQVEQVAACIRGT